MPARVIQRNTVSSIDEAATLNTDPLSVITSAERRASTGNRVIDYSTSNNRGGSYVFASMIHYNDRVEVWRYSENGEFLRVQSFLRNDPRLVGFTPQPETREEASRIAEEEYQAVMEANRIREATEAERRARELREGNHWTVTTIRGSNGRTRFAFSRDSYSAATQEQARETYLNYLREEKRNRFREINRMMNQLEAYTNQEDEVKALELWPDPTAATYTPPERGAA